MKKNLRKLVPLRNENELPDRKLEGRVNICPNLGSWMHSQALENVESKKKRRQCETEKLKIKSRSEEQLP